MKVVFISDTHSQHEKLDMPEGDLLIHSGDFTTLGKVNEIVGFNDWLGKQPLKHKIIIAGNHDLLFESNNSLARSLITNAIYLENSEVNIEGLKIYGTPVSPRFYNWAFNKERGSEINRYWDMIPNNVDILITHSPPYKILDKSFKGEYCGCEGLLEKIKLVKPKIHCFGHIHESYGILEQDNIKFINSSSLDSKYQPTNKPIVLEI